MHDTDHLTYCLAGECLADVCLARGEACVHGACVDGGCACDDGWCGNMCERHTPWTVAVFGGNHYGAAQCSRSNPSCVDNTVERYDTAQMSWSSVGTITYRDWPAAAFLDGKIYITGGQPPQGENLRSVEVFDISTDTWSNGPDMGSARYYHSAASMGGKIYVIGGVPFVEGVWQGDSVEVLNPNLGSWVVVPPLPTARYMSAVVAVGATLFVIGGAEGSQSFGHRGVFAVMETYLDGAAGWDPAPPPPIASFGSSAAVLNQCIFVVGGYNREGDGPGHPLDSLQKYDIVAASWSTLSAMPTARHGLAAVAIRSTILAIGGGAATSVATVEEFDPVTNSWSSVSALPTPRRRLAAVAWRNDACTSSCGVHGTCTTDGACACDNGWGGEHCEISSSSGRRALSEHTAVAPLKCEDEQSSQHDCSLTTVRDAGAK